MPVLEVEEEARLGSVAECRIVFLGVVVEVKLVQSWDKAHEIQEARAVALADAISWDVVPSLRNPLGYARDVELRAFQAGVPHSDAETCVDRLVQESCHRSAAERGFEGEVLVPRDRHLETVAALLPDAALSLLKRKPRGVGEELPHYLVRVEVVGSCRTETGASDAALAASIGASKNENRGYGLSHESAQPERPSGRALRASS